MGTAFSNHPSVIEEQQRWLLPHKLEFNVPLRQRQLQDVEKFDFMLKLCSMKKTFGDGLFGYEHWFITDGSWFMEFGNFHREPDGRLRVHDDPSEFVQMQNGDFRNAYVIHNNFSATPDVKSRMSQMCGAVNASFCLRNAEHVARYVHCGCWVSFQTARNGGGIRFQFESVMTERAVKLTNVLPDNLKEEVRLDERKMYPECTYFVQYLNTADAINRSDDKCYSVVFLGPTGSGKSRLINLLFNQEVSKSEPTAVSVTKDVKFFQGEIQNLVLTIPNSNRRHGPITVNLVDTIGLCDSMLSKCDVYDWIKDRVKVNIAAVDVVVVVCSGRIEKVQADAIKQYLEWLQYSKYPKNFVFVYNKADGLSGSQKTQNLLQMAELIGLDASTKFVDVNDAGEKKSVDLRFTTGFSPSALFSEIRNDREKLADAILCERKEKICLDESTCVIL